MSDLEDEINVLRRKVQAGEEALQRAGQYGLQLLDDKMDLHNKLEDQRIEMSNIIEVLANNGSSITTWCISQLLINECCLFKYERISFRQCFAIADGGAREILIAKGS